MTHFTEHFGLDPQYSLPLLAPDGNYCPEQVGINKDINPSPFPLFSIFPNPFNPTTTIRFNIPIEIQHSMSLQIFDITGRLVETYIDGKMDLDQNKRLSQRKKEKYAAS